LVAVVLWPLRAAWHWGRSCLANQRRMGGYDANTWAGDVTMSRSMIVTRVCRRQHRGVESAVLDWGGRPKREAKEERRVQMRIGGSGAGEEKPSAARVSTAFGFGRTLPGTERSFADGRRERPPGV